MVFINIIDKDIINNITFKINPCLEFACALRLVGKRDMLFNMAREINFTIDKQDKKLFESLESTVSKYIRNEIEYFYGICDIEIIIAAFVADYDNVDNVSGLLRLIESADEKLLFKYLGGIFISQQLPEFNADWNEVTNDIETMKNYIESSKVDELSRKESLLECFDNPEETKQRIYFILKQFYEKSYKYIEEEVLKEIQRSEDNYKKLLEINPSEFMKKYFFNFFKPENERWNYKLNVHLSLFLQIYFWNINIHDYKEKMGWCVLGVRNNELFFKKETKDRVDRFLKVLSDKRRIEIIKLLSYKPYYGYEIAAKLNLTPATVGYHISFLMEADIITYDREENKVYYILNKDKIKELLKETGLILLNE